jgi:predicted TPR repeat methyltransferase
LKNRHILTQPATYEVVSAFYCTEEVGIHTAAWEAVMANLCRTVAPGGMLYLSCLRNTDYYVVGDSRYPCAYISEEDLRRVLPELGFDMSNSLVEGVAVEHQEGEGVLGVVLVAARKKS